ncbi:MAG TPA: alkyl sulfatase C-terminal domain-containing protein [Bacillota bacterium]|jgi:putative sterol carrier protein|nr:alkyl sulfatase C-terminal domain-containing protein [Peptococcaceae bacterium MAG4]NLW38711.1 sterol carrier protein [Peptococcaceae bacterium]HPZ44060.1 alkyl sulfatase C-terminal domain-containing protein [Bacillota bacterium]HQD75191.1 alkyl sulfatase C-terminal domain-containing protein [Bacillota bacterium]HUM58005.1 alkyl sulfatase C-terminal domain-containing protein [Bacillota bacterium]
MATHEEITESLRVFTEKYNKNERLKIMNRDWNRVVVVQATDVDSQHTLTLVDGVVSLKEGKASNPDLTVISDSETLADIFYGDITPTGPYNNGTLRIIGSEDDIIRLDFISLMIWGE